MKNISDLKILVVEHDAVQIANLQRLFQIFGFHIVVAKDFADASTKISTTKFDVVLLDMHSKTSGGMDLLAKLKKTDPHQPKVFAITNNHDHDVADLMHMGVDGFFAKPFDASAVRTTLNQAILEPRERWSSPMCVLKPFVLRMQMKNHNDAKNTKQFALGRLGFFAHIKAGTPKAGDWVEFHIEFSDNNPCSSLEGLGQVVWRHMSGDIGVEFRYINGECLEKFVMWHNNNKTISSIPSL